MKKRIEEKKNRPDRTMEERSVPTNMIVVKMNHAIR